MIQASPLWVKVEVEGQEDSMMLLRPGDSYVVTLTVDVAAGNYMVDMKKRRSIRLTVPQEGIAPPGAPPWEPKEDS
jgi:hypothetical protein